jgi:DNA-binding NtrC family response regulator
MTSGASGPRKILVVDDDAEVRATTCEYLAMQGFEVIEATNGLEALLQFKHAKPVGVVLDLRMPRLGGVDALKRMVAFDPAVRVVVVTGEVDAQLGEQALGLGAKAVLRKPVVLPDLLAALGIRPNSAAAAAGPSTTHPEKPQTAHPPAAMAGRILVVDDDADMRATLEEFVTSKGYDTRSAADGAAALRDIIQAPPDVVLLDIDMPGLKGVDALPAILAVAPNTRVIMVSGTADIEVAKRALAYGAFDYVVKPVDLRYLTKSLQTLMTMKSIDAPDA